MDHSKSAAQIVNLDSPATRPKPKTLVIGDILRWQAQGMHVAPFDGLEFIAIDALSPQTIARLTPETILSPLIADTFDAVEVAQLLAGYGFAGRYCAISGPLPDRAAIIAEVAKHAPAIWFDIFVVPA